MSLPAAISALVTIAGTLTGVRRVYPLPPNSISDYPSAIAYPVSGTLESASQGHGKGLHVIRVDVFSQKGQLEERIAAVLTWPSEFQIALSNDQRLGGSVNAIVWPITYQARPVQYGKEVPFTMRFDVTIKLMEVSA